MSQGMLPKKGLFRMLAFPCDYFLSADNFSAVDGDNVVAFAKGVAQAC